MNYQVDQDSLFFLQRGDYVSPKKQYGLYGSGLLKTRR
jgi:hypothetical protein